MDSALPGVPILKQNPAISLSEMVVDSGLGRLVAARVAKLRAEFARKNPGAGPGEFIEWAWDLHRPSKDTGWARELAMASVLVGGLKKFRQRQDLPPSDLPEVYGKVGRKVGRGNIEGPPETLGSQVQEKGGSASRHVVQNNPNAIHGKLDFHVVPRGTARGLGGDWPDPIASPRGEFRVEYGADMLIANLKGEWTFTPVGHTMHGKAGGAAGLHVRGLDNVAAVTGYTFKKDGELMQVRTRKKKGGTFVHTRDGDMRRMEVDGPFADARFSFQYEEGEDWCCIIAVEHFIIPNLFGPDFLAKIQERVTINNGKRRVLEPIRAKLEPAQVKSDGVVLHQEGGGQLLTKFIKTVDLDSETLKKYSKRARGEEKSFTGIREFRVLHGRFKFFKTRPDKQKPNSVERIQDVINAPDSFACLAFADGSPDAPVWMETIRSLALSFEGEDLRQLLVEECGEKAGIFFDWVRPAVEASVSFHGSDILEEAWFGE